MSQQRINELAIQAGGIWRGGYVEQANGDSVYTDKKFVSGGDMDVEQFARLIVRECLLELADVRLEHVFDPETDKLFKIAIDRIKTTFRG